MNAGHLSLSPRLEPGKWKALALAVLVHVLLILALVMGVQWLSLIHI